MILLQSVVRRKPPTSWPPSLSGCFYPVWTVLKPWCVSRSKPHMSACICFLWSTYLLFLPIIYHIIYSDDYIICENNVFLLHIFGLCSYYVSRSIFPHPIPKDKNKRSCNKVYVMKLSYTVLMTAVQMH